MEDRTTREDNDPFKYRAIASDKEFGKVIEPLLKLTAQIRNPHLLKAAQAYRDNMVSTQFIASLPSHLALNAAWSDSVLLRSKILAGDITDLRKIDFSDKSFTSKSDAIFNELSSTTSENIDSEVALESRGHSFAINWLTGHYPTTLRSLYKSLIIESYLFFEAVAGDLWWAAVDHGSATFKQRVNASKLKKDSGEIKPSFQKLDTIEKAYAVILDAPKDTLLKNDIVLLSQFRNVIVHRAGIVDQMFLDKVKGFPDFDTLPLGQPIKLDGEIVARLRKASIDTVHELLTKVLAIQDPAPAT